MQTKDNVLPAITLPKTKISGTGFRPCQPKKGQQCHLFLSKAIEDIVFLRAAGPMALSLELTLQALACARKYSPVLGYMELEARG